MAHIAIQRLFQSIPKGFDPHTMGNITIRKTITSEGMVMTAQAPLKLFICASVLPNEVEL